MAYALPFCYRDFEMEKAKGGTRGPSQVQKATYEIEAAFRFMFEAASLLSNQRATRK